jgi:hypothetical protein
MDKQVAKLGKSLLLPQFGKWDMIELSTRRSKSPSSGKLLDFSKESARQPRYGTRVRWFDAVPCLRSWARIRECQGALAARRARLFLCAAIGTS